MANFLGRLQTLLFGAAIGRASSDSVTPVLEPVRQHAWERNQVKVLDPRTAAELVARRFITQPEGESDSSKGGVAANRFNALIQLAQTYPGLADLDKLSNRQILEPAEVRKVLDRHGIPEVYVGPLIELFSDLLSPSEVANAVQQGHVPNAGILPEIDPAVPPAEGAVAPLTPDEQPPSHVPLTQVDLDPVREAAGQGIDLPRLRVLANLAGLPPGAETVLAMWNRGLIDEETVDAGIREGHLKTKWAHAFKRMRWAVLSGQEYAEARLRDWISEEEMYRGGALTGHTKSQMDLFYKNRGRTATPRQLWLAVARKVVGPNYPGQESRTSLADFKDHEEAIRRSNIRPEYAKMLWDIRFNYPSLFQLNRLVQSGAVDADTAALWASYNLEAPEVVDALKTYWASLGAGATADPHVVKAETQLWTAIHKAYVKDGLDEPRTDRELTTLIPDNTIRARVLQLWSQELDLSSPETLPLG